MPSLARPCPAQPCHAMPGHAMPGPAEPRRAEPDPALLRHWSSQTSPRQSGGMMPSLSAAAIMPRCLLSARRTWHRRQRVRRFAISLLPSFPLLMWSQWHSSNATGTPQWVQHPPSRSQTRRRRSSHISRGGRRLGTFTPSQFQTIRFQSDQIRHSVRRPGRPVCQLRSLPIPSVHEAR